MSARRKKKPTAHQKNLAKAKARTTRDEELPPPEAVAAYVEVFEWVQENPENAATLQGMQDIEWANPMAGIAFAEQLGFPDDEVQQQAWNFRAWHILNGFKYAMHWPTSIAAMSIPDIIDQLRADAAAGKISMSSD